MTADEAGWVTMALVVVAVFSLLRAASGPLIPGAPRRIRFAMFSAGVLCTVAVGRGVGIDNEVTAWGRSESIEGGWYEERGSYQATVTILGGIALLAVLAAVWRKDQRSPRPGIAMPLFWFAAWTFLQFARVVSEHHVDQILEEPIGPFEFGWLLEWGLLAALSVSVPVLRRRAPRLAPTRLLR